MDLWQKWFECVKDLRVACTRKATFLWMVVFLAAISMRCGDLAGVTSVVRIMGLMPFCYDRLLDFLHSPGLNLTSLTQAWVSLVLKIFPGIVTINNKYVILGDGIKIAKEGKKMPAVKKLHQDSDSNSKAEYIMGHSCQAIALLAEVFQSAFAIPLTCRIHEGVVFSNRDTRTLLDKMLDLLGSVRIPKNFYFIADAYYVAKKMIHGLLKNGNHLISRVKSNAIAYYPATENVSRRGRPKKYGNKIKLKTLFKDLSAFYTIASPLKGDKKACKIQYRVIDLLWRRAGILVRYVAVIHPSRGRIILMSTDLKLSAVEIIKLYGLRFKIEFSFKQALHTLGTYSYHFWMKAMKPIKRNSGDQYLHKESEEYRNAVRRKINTYHKYIQLGIIAQGLLQYLASVKSTSVWKRFGSWIRTIRPGIPASENVVGVAIKNSFPEFLAGMSDESTFKKFLCEKLDLSRVEGCRLNSG